MEFENRRIGRLSDLVKVIELGNSGVKILVKVLLYGGSSWGIRNKMYVVKETGGFIGICGYVSLDWKVR